MIVADTTVWIDYFSNRSNPQTDWLDRALTRQPLALTDLILCEILQGIRSDADFEKTLRLLRVLPIFSAGGEQVAIAAAQNYRLLRAQGITIRKTIDCLIATFCITNGHTLLHRDRDFDPFEQHLGLSVLRP